jgi:hypothetical protein
LSVDGCGKDVKLEGNTFDGPETLLKITLPPGISTGDVQSMTIVGKAKVGDQMVSVAANQRELLRAMFPNTLSLPRQLEDTIAVGVGPPFPPFFDLSLASRQIYFPQLVGKSSFDINVNRTNEAFKEPVTLSIEGLPAGITAAIAPVGDGLKAMRVSLKGPAYVTEAEFPVRIVGTGKFQEQTRVVVLDKLSLRTTKPLVVSVTMLGPIVCGGQQQAEVHIQRFGDKPQKVRLQLSDGPPGLSAPIFVTVPIESDRVKIPIRAEVTATPGKFKNLVVVASTTVNEQNVTVQSEPASIEIQPPK